MALIASRADFRSAAGAAAVAHGRQQVELLRERLALVATGGRDAHIQRHRARGKLLPRERIDQAVDDGTAFLELSPRRPGNSTATRCRGRASSPGWASSPGSPACSSPTMPP